MSEDEFTQFDWLSFDIIEFGLAKQEAFANRRKHYRIANNLPREREKLRNGVEEKDQ